jgi:uncharacterized protein (DUF433 family)
MGEILAVGSDCLKPLGDRVGACYRRLMEPSENPGVCSGDPPAIMERGPDGPGWITGTRVYAWQVVQAADRLGSAAAVAAELGLSHHQVRVALEFAERAAAADSSGSS